LLGYAESCKRKVTISAREMATNHQIKEESPYKPEAFNPRLFRAIALTFALKQLQTKTNPIR